jgi:hypothetical protein
MGANKNSFPKGELVLYPKFTTKDFHMCFPRSRSHTRSTNPRNKPQTIPRESTTQEAKDLAILPKPCQTAHVARADGLRGKGGRPARTGRTVCDPRANGLRPSGGRSVKRNRTISSATRNSDSLYPTRGLSEGNSSCVDGPQPLGGRSAKPLPARINWPNGSKRGRSRTRNDEGPDWRPERG